MDGEVPEDVIELGRRAHAAFPTVPLLGTDIVRDQASGRLYVLEVNANGWTFHLTSEGGERMRRDFGLDLRAQFGGAAAVARGIDRRLREVSAGKKVQACLVGAGSVGQVLQSSSTPLSDSSVPQPLGSGRRCGLAPKEFGGTQGGATFRLSLFEEATPGAPALRRRPSPSGWGTCWSSTAEGR